MERPYDGPYKITQVYTNGTVTIKKGAVYQRHNIRRIQPYYDINNGHVWRRMQCALNISMLLQPASGYEYLAMSQCEL